MKKQVVTRYAPSPTGYMHVGNLRTALYSYLTARKNGGKFILRIEDTDQARFVADATKIIIDTLHTAGLKYDEGPDIGGPNGPYTQSERKAIYMQYAQDLVDQGKAYYCFCQKRNADEDCEAIVVDPCADLPLEEAKKKVAEGASFTIRHRVKKTGTTTFVDNVFGEITVQNDTLHDIILIKSDGMPTYNFAHIIDDHLMGVTHVLRGSEFITSTPQFIQLHNDLGFEVPQFYHLPLIMGKNEAGEVSKLSKRHGAVAFSDLVALGYLPQAIINYISLLGWHPADTDQEIFSLSELEQVFDTANIRKSAAIFDYDKLKWVNSQYILKMTPAEFKEYAMPYIRNTLTRDVFDVDKLCEILQPRVQIFSEIAEKIEFFQDLVDFDINLLFNPKKKTDEQNSKEILSLALQKLQSVELSDWHNDVLYQQLEDICVQTGLKPVSVMWVVRIALSGQTVTVGGATEIMQILGKSETMIRLQTTLNRL